VFLCNVTSVCENSLPLMVAPVLMMIAFLAMMTPLKTAFVPMETPVSPATCQKTFLAKSPPVNNIFVSLAWVRLPSIWKIQISFSPPLRVTFALIEISVRHL